MAQHRLVGIFQFGTTGNNKLKYPKIVEESNWEALEKLGRKNGINAEDVRQVVTLGW